MHRPKVGERIILELLASGESYPSEVQAVDDSVMRVTPAMRGPDLPEPGGAVRITFVRKDGIYEEHGTVAEISRESEIVLTLQLDGEIARTQRRDFIRKDASLNTDLTAQGKSFRGVTKDVSGGGISLMFNEIPPLSEAEEVVILLEVSAGRAPVRARGRATEVGGGIRGGRWRVGGRL